MSRAEPLVIGITGSIGMGKTTVGSMLETLGVAVHDSDGAVHDLLQIGQAGYAGVRASFDAKLYPAIYRDNGDINRKELGALVFSDQEKKRTLEEILHPLVRQSQNDFIRKQGGMGAEIVALDIPLLFETGADKNCDVVLVVSAPENIQRTRVLARPNMTEEKFHAIVAQQMPDGEKCARADYIIKTGLSRADTMKQVKHALLGIELNIKEKH